MTLSPQIISESTPHKVSGTLGALTLGALGVVYGDIGTSPLYTLKTVLEWAGSAAPDVAYGSLSLIVWTLIITTSIKYVGLVMRADNDGEGGILALMARLALKGRQRPGLIAMGILGAALLYGDGAITPAISVLSALEGQAAVAGCSAVYPAARGGGTDRAVLPAAQGNGGNRAPVRTGHVHLVCDHRDSRCNQRP